MYLACSVNSKAALSVLHKRMVQPKVRVQLLCLTTAEACVKNCGPVFHEALAVSPFFNVLKDTAMHPDTVRACPLFLPHHTTVRAHSSPVLG